jgi:hypothetical protein
VVLLGKETTAQGAALSGGVRRGVMVEGGDLLRLYFYFFFSVLLWFSFDWSNFFFIAGA